MISIYKFCLGASLILGLSACSMQPLTSSTRVEIAPSIQVNLPLPQELGYSLTASQLIGATWQQNSSEDLDTSAISTSKETNQQLPVQLQVTKDKVVLAGFSSWGTRILSLTYSQKSIKTSVLAGLEGSLPKPEQVLFNLMITLWPLNAWEQPLNQVTWRMVETNNSRRVYDQNGTLVIDINYHSTRDKDDLLEKNKLSGDIEFNHIQLGYKIHIQTLNYTTQ
ncbi:DUF3261 domain-containing protein [Vibrio genomosp. F6]|uniref:DUF3261 domain-containing protein n=1 Tax=Vibrio genomosp. F6 TaxID=723172 RepID=UPI0010BDE3FE|nr:DUF3261 domain-containing protein [Vibrio genomosp. F6]TKF22703.1 DUF3261 domain-containing protein [Vibrio genomosp. F6]